MIRYFISNIAEIKLSSFNKKYNLNLFDIIKIIFFY